MRTVTCTTEAGFSVSSNHRCCAERLMLRALCRRARVCGAQRHAVARWVVRHAGAFTVARRSADGAAVVSLPCVLCRRALDGCLIRWTATTREGLTVNEETAPPSVPTSRQARFLF